MMNFPLVYHFTGTELPSWALVTLRSSARRWPGSVVLIHDRTLSETIPGLEIHFLHDWYDPEPFSVFSRNFRQPKDFRDGFWHHAIERFFILSQWAEVNNVPRFLHTELDVLLMGHEALATALPLDRPGVMYPRASEESAGANFLYVSGVGALRPLLDFFTANSGSEFEMNLLARFLDEKPRIARALPSHYDLEKAILDPPDSSSESLSELGGVIDVHPMGTWIFGQDPRNAPGGPVLNHFYYPTIGSEFVDRLRYKLDFQQTQLSVKNVDGRTWPIYALHIHSKLMRRAHNPLMLWFYASLANLPWPTVIIFQNFDSVLRRLARRLVDVFFLRLVVPFRLFIARDGRRRNRGE